MYNCGFDIHALANRSINFGNYMASILKYLKPLFWWCEMLRHFPSVQNILPPYLLTMPLSLLVLYMKTVKPLPILSLHFWLLPTMKYSHGLTVFCIHLRFRRCWSLNFESQGLSTWLLDSLGVNVQHASLCTNWPCGPCFRTLKVPYF